MTIKSFVHNLAWCACAALAAVSLAACDGIIYDDEGDCSVTYKVKFIDNYNLLYADAFDSEVERVTLYALDGQGAVVWQHTAEKDELRAGENSMTLDLAPGDYELVAWAEGRTGDALAPWQAMGSSGSDALSRRLALTSDHAIDSGLSHLFHGSIHVSLPAEEDPETFNREFVYPMQLVKNTNSVTIVVQQVDGTLVDPHDFDFMLVADNTCYDAQNNIIRQGNTSYHGTWSTRYAEAEIDTDDDNSGESAAKPRRAERRPTVVSELHTGRLMAGDNVRLVVMNKATGKQMLSFPLIDYLLLVRSQFINRMPDQEYLDRQYDCSIVFFLDESGNDPELKGSYINVTVGVLSWRLVLQDSPL